MEVIVILKMEKLVNKIMVSGVIKLPAIIVQLMIKLIQRK